MKKKGFIFNPEMTFSFNSPRPKLPLIHIFQLRYLRLVNFRLNLPTMSVKYFCVQLLLLSYDFQVNIKVFDASSLGFHNIVRRAFRASLQSERNLLSDRLNRVDKNLKEVETINLNSDRMFLKVSCKANYGICVMAN